MMHQHGCPLCAIPWRIDSQDSFKKQALFDSVRFHTTRVILEWYSRTMSHFYSPQKLIESNHEID